MGGNAADNGSDVEAEYIQFLYFFKISWNVAQNPSKMGSRSGQNGDDGGNIDNIERPAQPIPFHKQVIMKEYIEYMKTKMVNNVQASVLSEFMHKLEKESMASAFETAKEFGITNLFNRKKK